MVEMEVLVKVVVKVVVDVEVMEVMEVMMVGSEHVETARCTETEIVRDRSARYNAARRD